MSWFETISELTQSVCGAQTFELVVNSPEPLILQSPGDDRATGFAATDWVEPHIIDLRSSENTLQLAEWVGAAAVVPVSNPSADLGWLIIGHEDPEAFTAETLPHLVKIASLIESYLDERLMTSELDKLSELLHQSERRLADTQAQLELSNQELEQFAYIAAHELVAPLRSVAVYGEVLATLTSDQADESPQLNSCVSEIRQGVTRMTEQVQYLLTLSRAQQAQPKLELVDTTRTAYGAVDTLTELLEDAGADVKIEALPAVLAHDIPLQSVFANLITNAVRYREPSRQLEVHIRPDRTGDTLNIEVADNASGISTEAQTRVFGLFERTSTDGDGLGVGLAVSRRILEGFGASISVTSSKQGSTFVLHFPLPSSAS